VFEQINVFVSLENTYSHLPEQCFAFQQPQQPDAPSLLVFNHELAQELGLSRADTPDDQVAALLSGKTLPEKSQPLAMAYAGHQFGNFVPQLGDGRALLLGEVVTPTGGRKDIQLKGSGRTPFSRGGDGLAAIGPVLREYLVSAAMARLGVPTTRAPAAAASAPPGLRSLALRRLPSTPVARCPPPRDAVAAPPDSPSAAPHHSLFRSPLLIVRSLSASPRHWPLSSFHASPLLPLLPLIALL